MGLLLRSGRLLLGAAIGAGLSACYSAGSGTAPPTNNFYFPTGLATQADMSGTPTALFVVNSDWDLQFNGGTLQGCDLAALRRDAALLVNANLYGGTPPDADGGVVFLTPLNCNSAQGPGSAIPMGGVQPTQGCAPPVASTTYCKTSFIIGAFATDLQLSVAPPIFPSGPPNRPSPPPRTRLFMPVSGDSSLTWADVVVGDPTSIDCGAGGDQRCAASHRAGSLSDPDDTRQVAMPGEPFGIAQTDDGTAVAITQQSDPETSLLLTGYTPSAGPESSATFGQPSMEYVLSGVPAGGIGLASVPHGAYSPVPPCGPLGVPPANAARCVRPAFLETNRTTAEIDLLRYYDDDQATTLHRPFLQREAVFPIVSNAVGTDTRGIVIDPTPRIACRAQTPMQQWSECDQLGARVFFASRTPPALGIAEIGGPPPEGAGDYNPDQLVYQGNVPLLPGPSKVYLAPIITQQGTYSLRVFVVLFDSSQIAVYDPDKQRTDFIDVGEGPFAMAFDPFSMDDVGVGAQAPGADSNGNRPYRFAYVTSFTQSYVQMIDLDNSQSSGQTFESVVYTLGLPTNPKGQ